MTLEENLEPGDHIVRVYKVGNPLKEFGTEEFVVNEEGELDKVER